MRIDRIAQHDGDIVEPLALHPVAQMIERGAIDILGQHAPLATHRRGQTHRIISPARADIGHAHAGANTRQRHHPRRLARAIALGLTGGRRRIHRRNRAGGMGKAARRLVPARVILAPVASSQRHQHQQGRKGGAQCAQSTSSTATFSPVTRWLSAAAMKGSSAPSSTSSGAVLVTPVRKSFTS